VETDKGVTTMSVAGSKYKMESKPGEVDENLAKVKKIQDKANEKIEPINKYVFGLNTLINNIKNNKDKFQEYKKVLLDTSSTLYENIPESEKSNIQTLVKNAN